MYRWKQDTVKRLGREICLKEQELLKLRGDLAKVQTEVKTALEDKRTAIKVNKVMVKKWKKAKTEITVKFEKSQTENGSTTSAVTATGKLKEGDNDVLVDDDEDDKDDNTTTSSYHDNMASNNDSDWDGAVSKKKEKGPSPQRGSKRRIPKEWACPTCTLLNTFWRSMCTMCKTQKPEE